MCIFFHLAPFISLNTPPTNQIGLPEITHATLQAFASQSGFAASLQFHTSQDNNTSMISSSSLAPLDSTSSLGLQWSLSVNSGRASSRLGKLRRTSSTGPPLITWTEAQCKEFKWMVLQLTASADFALSWVENPEFTLLCDIFLPGCPWITRKMLTTILRDIVNDFRLSTKAKVHGREVTLQSDGWGGLNNHHLNAFMITCNKQVRYPFMESHLIIDF